MADDDNDRSNHQEQPTEDTSNFIIYDDDVEEGIDSCSKSLIRRILTQKPIHTNSLQSALAGIWCNPKGFRVEEIVPKTFQFYFDDEADVNRILKGSPWLFRYSWLILMRWVRDLNIDSLDFSCVAVRVQLWGLPAHCRTPKMGSKIGACLGQVLEYDVFECKERKSFLKILVNLDTQKPLLTGVPVGSNKDGVTWVEFQYEKLPQFCYLCGRIGHDDMFCNSSPKAPIDENENDREYALSVSHSHPEKPSNVDPTAEIAPNLKAQTPWIIVKITRLKPPIPQRLQHAMCPIMKRPQRRWNIPQKTSPRLKKKTTLPCGA
ncbi:Zinc knuckle CX2CX4HX4C [Sesbania bispinosa]|nr:Zinc knuckle CX2CX4HX4C [Sesbania bispinosa]